MLSVYDETPTPPSPTSALCCRSVCETPPQSNKSQTLAYLSLVEGDDAVDL